MHATLHALFQCKRHCIPYTIQPFTNIELLYTWNFRYIPTWTVHNNINQIITPFRTITNRLLSKKYEKHTMFNILLSRLQHSRCQLSKINFSATQSTGVNIWPSRLLTYNNERLLGIPFATNHNPITNYHASLLFTTIWRVAKSQQV